MEYSIFDKSAMGSLKQAILLHYPTYLTDEDKMDSENDLIHAASLVLERIFDDLEAARRLKLLMSAAKKSKLYE